MIPPSLRRCLVLLLLSAVAPAVRGQEAADGAVPPRPPAATPGATGAAGAAAPPDPTPAASGTAGALADSTAQAAPARDPDPASVPDPAPVRDPARHAEMIGRMRAAVEEIAGLYGSPAFTQVFTNDPAEASELRRRLDAASSATRLERQVADLAGRRDALAAEVARREHECRRLAERLIRERAALEALAGAMDQARRATEASAP